jgi:hypothetical protein
MLLGYTQRFWSTLTVVTLLVVLLGWFAIPAWQSGNPAADGTVVKGFPLPVETYGGCQMIVDTCQDFSAFNLVVDIAVLLGVATAITVVLTRPETWSEGITQLSVYAGGWVGAVFATMVFAAALTIIANTLLYIEPALWLVSIVYNVLFFYYDAHHVKS